MGGVRQLRIRTNTEEGPDELREFMGGDHACCRVNISSLDCVLNSIPCSIEGCRTGSSFCVRQQHRQDVDTDGELHIGNALREPGRRT